MTALELVPNLTASQKAGVELNLAPSLVAFIRRMTALWYAVQPEDADGITFTAGSEGTNGDGVHMKNSLHYFGKAVDLRIRDTRIEEALLFWELAKRLAGSEFDVVWEKDHIHIEFDPKTAEGRQNG